MKVSYKGDYAIKTILSLTERYGEEPVNIQTLATQSDIPIKFLEQILLALKSGDFVQSRRGKSGGYQLARHPSQISLGQVMRFIDGPIEPLACVDASYKGCADITGCVLRDVWRRVAESTAQIVDSVTFEKLAEKKRGISGKDYQI